MLAVLACAAAARVLQTADGAQSRLMLSLRPGRASCAAAYAQYAAHWNYSFSGANERRERTDYFCESVRVLLAAARDGRATFGLTPYMDRPPPSGGRSLHPRPVARLHAAKELCVSVSYLPDPLPEMPELPAAIDLREEGLCAEVKDQASCGSCWAFGTTAVAEAAILRDRAAYEADPVLAPYFDLDASALSVSEQFLMNTSDSGVNYYCDGGNYIYAVLDLADGLSPTLELTEHFPYQAAKGGSPAQIVHPAPKLPRDAYLNPFATVAVGDTGCTTNVVDLTDPVLSGTWDDTVRWRIKSYLARGIVIAASMATGGGGMDVRRLFTMYTGGVFDYACLGGSSSIDHQIALVGYGTYKGTPVWVFRNSWGASWGTYGYFMVPQGTNSMCTEYSAFTSIPRTMDITAPPQRFRKTSWQQNIYEGRIVRGRNGLDSDDGSYFPEDTIQRISPSMVAVVAIGCVLSVLFVTAVAGGCWARRRYTRATIQEARRQQ